MGTDLSVVNAARVSFDKESELEAVYKTVGRDDLGYMEKLDYYKLKDSDVKLINYLAKHKHFSPFNHSFLTFRIKAPIFVARQLVKHKFMPWNEVSRRYVDSEPEFYIPDGFRKKSENVKQGSAEGFIEHNENAIDCLQRDTEAQLRAYLEYLDAGVCAEQARMVLPQNTMTEWIWSGTLGAYADMLKLRLDPHTQYESRIVAQLIEKQIAEKFPVSLKALLENK